MGQRARDFGHFIKFAVLKHLKTNTSKVFINMSDAQHNLYALTSPQREIWLDQILHEAIPLYNLATYVEIPGSLDSMIFEQAVNLLVEKYDTLRTMITKKLDEDGIPFQTYVKHWPNSLTKHDFSLSENPQEIAMAWMQQRFLEPFELTGQPLFRYDLVKASEDHYYWLAQYHHIIVDGYTYAMLNRSMAKIYTQLATGQFSRSDSPSYIKFIDHDRAFIESETFEKHRQYWIKKYPAPPDPLLSPRYRSHYPEKIIGSDCEVLSMSRVFYNRLHEFAKQKNVTFFRVLLGALYVYFTRTAQRDDFTVGFPILNRTTDDFKHTAGVFVLNNPTLFNFGKELSFSELLEKIDQTLKQDFCHQPFPSSKVNQAVSRGQGNKRSVLLDIIVSYVRFNFEAQFGGIKSHSKWLLNPWEQAPLTINVEDFHTESDVKFNLVFNLAYFNANDIKLLQKRLGTIFEAILEDPTIPIHTLPIMTDQETRQLKAWNDTAADYPLSPGNKALTLVALFEQQVKKKPDGIALVFEKQKLTYRQLNEKANQLAHYLLSLKTETGAPLLAGNPLIAIALERSLEMVIGLLAILKAGGAYVPIDPSYPEIRIQYMLDDSAAPLLLTQNHLKARLPPKNPKNACVVLCLEEIPLSGQPTENPLIQSQTEDLAYVIYTSGSTGKPKGVMVEHGGVANLALTQISAFQIHPESRVLQFASFSFDASVSEITTALLAGAGLYLLPKKRIAGFKQFYDTNGSAADQPYHLTPPLF